MGDKASIGRAIREKLSQTIRDVMLVAADAVTNATPVDTGNASNNWVLTTGSPFQGTDGSRASPSDAAQRAGIERIRRYDVGRDGPVYLRNNVDYLEYLDRGHSQQAPPGFVAKALMNGLRRAPHGMKERVRGMLKAMARSAYLRHK